MSAKLLYGVMTFHSLFEVLWILTIHVDRHERNSITEQNARFKIMFDNKLIYGVRVYLTTSYKL